MKLSNVLKLAAVGCFLISFASGCKNNSTTEYGYEKLYPNADKIVFDDFSVVELSKDVPLGDIQKIFVEDSLIFISSDDNLYSFNMDGSLHARYGMKGRASNEYLYLSAYYIDASSKQVCLIDGTQGKLLYYGYDGSFIRKAECDALKSLIYDVRLLSDGRLFVHNYIYNDSGLLYSIVDLKDGSVKELKSVPFSTDNTAEFCGEHMCNVFDGKLYYIAPFEPAIYVLDGDKETSWKQIPGVDNVPGKSELKNITDFNFFTAFNMYNEDEFVGFTGLYETGSFIFMNELHEINYYIIDKSTGKQKRYQYSLEDDVKTLPVKNIRAAYQDWFIGIGKVMSLMQLREDLPEKTSDPFLRKFKDVADKTTIDSNPCLFFYKIKSI